MGAGQSTSQMPQKKTLSSTIDYLAANYILTSNFQDLKNLTDPQYCKNLVILTSDVISRYLSQTELEYLKQRMEGGVETLKMTETPEKVAYFNKNSLDKMDVKSDLKKKRMCIGVAKYYVQIFHVFNAIAHTINPVYTWKDKFGSTVTVDYEHRNQVPSDIQPTISKVNLCSSRINALMKDKSILDVTSPNQIIDIKSGFCGLNSNSDGSSKPLTSEPGIPELETLYYDVYDYNIGKFTTMSDEMKAQYNTDLQTFYTLFTGKTELPKEITKFGQIPLRNYKTINQCKTNGAFTKSYSGTLKDRLFKEYVDNLKLMMKNTEDNQNALLAIIDQLFVFIKDPQDPNKKLIVINPKLTNKLLSKLVVDARVGILKLYTTCEADFFKGLQIFEALVEKQIIDTSTAQIKRLQQNVEETISLDSVDVVAPIAVVIPTVSTAQATGQATEAPVVTEVPANPTEPPANPVIAPQVQANPVLAKAHEVPANPVLAKAPEVPANPVLAKAPEVPAIPTEAPKPGVNVVTFSNKEYENKIMGQTTNQSKESNAFGL
jgi:hypothetical protein